MTKVYQIDDKPERRAYLERILEMLGDDWEDGFEGRGHLAWCSGEDLIRPIVDSDGIIILDIMLRDDNWEATLSTFKSELIREHIDIGTWISHPAVQDIMESDNHQRVAAHILAAARANYQRVLVSSEYELNREAAEDLNVDLVSFPKPGRRTEQNALERVVSKIRDNVSAFTAESRKWQEYNRRLRYLFDTTDYYHDIIGWLHPRRKPAPPEKRDRIIRLANELALDCADHPAKLSFKRAIEILKALTTNATFLPLPLVEDIIRASPLIDGRTMLSVTYPSDKVCAFRCARQVTGGRAARALHALFASPPTSGRLTEVKVTQSCLSYLVEFDNKNAAEEAEKILSSPYASTRAGTGAGPPSRGQGTIACFSLARASRNPDLSPARLESDGLALRVTFEFDPWIHMQGLGPKS